MGLFDTLRDWFDKIRDWIDGKKPDPVEELERAAPPVLVSDAEALKKRLLQAIEISMRDQLFREQSGVVYVPQHFVVFLNPADDSALRGEKRQRMEKTLGDYALERAGILSRNAKITAKAIRVELRVDATLESGELRAEPVTKEAGPDIRRDTIPTPPAPVIPAPPTLPLPVIPALPTDKTIPDPYATIRDTGQTGQLLYRLEVWRGGQREQDIPVLRRNLTVGRESPNKSANVRVKTDDSRFSRLQFELICDEENRLWVSALGQNAFAVGDSALNQGDKKELPRGAEIELYGFVFRPVFA